MKINYFLFFCVSLVRSTGCTGSVEKGEMKGFVPIEVCAIKID